jgi:hypothetical protein
VVSSIRTRRRNVWSSVFRRKIGTGWDDAGAAGGVPAPNLSMCRVERRTAGACLYMRQRVRIVCREDRKDE